MKPCIFSYGVDQFDDGDEVEKGHKSSLFYLWYFPINIGMLIGCSVPVRIQVNIGWGRGFGVSAVAMAIDVVFFFIGTRLNRYQKPSGNPLTRICQVLVASLRKYRVEVLGDKSFLYETADAESAIVVNRKLDHTNQFCFLDKATMEKESDHSNNSINLWRLSTITQVEKMKRIIRLLPMLATRIIFNIIFGQMSNLLLLLVEYMDAQLGRSNFKILVASLAIFNPISIIFWVPIYDLFIILVTRKFTGHKNGLTQLECIGTSLFISVFGIISVGILEIFCLRIVRQYNSYKVIEMPIFIFWQVPQDFIIGCAEVFTNIEQLKFFYEQASDLMRSLCAVISLTTTAIGNY
ncbi:UNVERIFIED_CONTAM: protein NRT1/ PTR FAMILY 8.1 [Sesamum radiatum]|uniref:Protein NRT1/ PTR FAMILY 8.1 n=1 Tax=Sesamum radiatum TaxID=300843 RepID=A0AAW2RDT4_SESRA